MPPTGNIVMALAVDEDHEIYGYIDSILPKRFDDEMTAAGEYCSYRGHPYCIHSCGMV